MNFYILVGLVKMPFLTQNHVFYRCVLIARVCKKALKSGADEFQDGLENRSKIDDKSSQNGFEMRFLFVMVFGIPLDTHFGAIWGPQIGSEMYSIIAQQSVLGPFSKIPVRGHT